MLLCLPLFLGFAAEAQAQTECVSEDLLQHVEARTAIATTDRWERIENALMEQPNPIALFEVKEVYERRKANGWSLNRLDEIIEAMECLAAPPLPDPISESCVSPQLQADVKAYSEETWHGSSHVERWLRVLQTFSGTANDSTIMTPAEAQEMAETWSASRWNPVVVALQCLEAEALNEQTEVQAEEPEDTPLPLQAEETPMPAQSPESLRVYFHGGTRPPGTEYRINEDDHWESELIIHYSGSADLGNTFCVNREIWGGDNHWNNGPITLPGFDTYVEATDPGSVILGVDGHWQCINDQTGSDNVTDSPYVTLVPGSTTDFVYRATVRTRDNNVVEDDFDIANELEFRFGTLFSGKTKYGPETLTEPDRAAYRLKRDVVAWAGVWGLGTGSAWTEFTNPTCGQVVPSKWIDRAPKINGNFDKSHSDYIVRANVSADTWLPDHCYPTKEVVKIPPTPSNTQPGVSFDNTELPIIEEDDVSWINLHKPRGGEWTVKLSKPVMVTDGDVYTGGNSIAWKETSAGITMHIYTRGTSGYDFLIPATNGIVEDKDYELNNLHRMLFPLTTGTRGEFRKISNWGTACKSLSSWNSAYDGKTIGGITLYVNGLTQGVQLEVDPPPDGSDLCN